MSKPKCPECEIVGFEYIISSDSNEASKAGDAWFNIVYCSECGHVYGVFAKHVLNHEMTPPTPPIPKLPTFR